MMDNSIAKGRGSPRKMKVELETIKKDLRG